MGASVRTTQREEIIFTISGEELVKMAAAKGTGTGNFKLVSSDIKVQRYLDALGTAVEHDCVITVKVVLEAPVIT
jgi:hypothetical protein